MSYKQLSDPLVGRAIFHLSFSISHSSLSARISNRNIVDPGAGLSAVAGTGILKMTK
jgi:hypothetical protein